MVTPIQRCGYPSHPHLHLTKHLCKLASTKKEIKGFTLMMTFVTYTMKEHGTPCGTEKALGLSVCFVHLMLAAQELIQAKRGHFIKVTGIKQVANSLVVSQT